jgi:hypothetical protein
LLLALLKSFSTALFTLLHDLGVFPKGIVVRLKSGGGKIVMLCMAVLLLRRCWLWRTRLIWARHCNS